MNDRPTAPASSRHHVVIVGAGFAGLYAARSLRKADVRITLIDRRNHHVFQPLLYQVATGGLNPSDIAAPIRSLVRGRNDVDVVLDEVVSIDRSRKQLTMRHGTVDYDTLVIATGATHSYFGHPEWEEAAPGLKTLEDALEIRRRVFLSFEAAEHETDEAKRQALLTFVVIGAGPTGVELAGTLGEIARTTLRRDFRHIDPRAARVLLIEGLDRVLQAYPEDLSAKAQRQLEALGVEVRLSTFVTAIDREGVTAGEDRIPSRTVLWAAGVAASPLIRTLGVPLDRAGRALVEPALHVPGDPSVFVLGDAAAAKRGDGFVPGVAPAAIQEGQHMARNIRRILAGQPLLPFVYRDKGSLATIGRAAAVGQVFGLKLSGFTAWSAWLGIHIMFLIGFRNRILVLLQWAWAYFTYERGARLITGDLRTASTATSGEETAGPLEKHLH